MGWHVYDASELALDSDGRPVAQDVLPMPATPETVAKLPAIIVKRISEEITNAVNPQ